jgi:acyl-CoA reductase-like NAD-dependent aldehyde dehydrogenase
MEAATATAALDSVNPRTLDSFNPGTGELLGSVPVTAPEAVAPVVDAVALVQPFWAQLTLGDRARYMERTAQARFAT